MLPNTGGDATAQRRKALLCGCQRHHNCGLACTVGSDCAGLRLLLGWTDVFIKHLRSVRLELRADGEERSRQRPSYTARVPSAGNAPQRLCTFAPRVSRLPTVSAAHNRGNRVEIGG